MIDDKVINVALEHVGKWAAAAEEWQIKYEEASQEIERLQGIIARMSKIYRHLNPEHNPGVYFIHGSLGTFDQNGMPEKLMVVPAYGVDFSYIYERTEKTTGPEW